MAGVFQQWEKQCHRCGARILWATTEGGHRLCIDAVPDSRGDLVVFGDREGILRAFHDANRLGAQAAGWVLSPDRWLAHRQSCARPRRGVRTRANGPRSDVR